MQSPSVFIIAGKQGEGKSSFAKHLAERLQKANLKVGGFIATGHISDSSRSGFDLSPIGTGKSVPLAKKAVTPANSAGVGHPQPEQLRLDMRSNFLFSEQALKTGKQIITGAIDKNETEIFILDEVGIFELNGEVWAHPLELLLNSFRGVLVITVRSRLLERVMAKWQIKPSGIFKIGMVSVNEAADAILGSSEKDTGGGLPEG